MELIKSFCKPIKSFSSPLLSELKLSKSSASLGKLLSSEFEEFSSSEDMLTCRFALRLDPTVTI